MNIELTKEESGLLKCHCKNQMDFWKRSYDEECSSNLPEEKKEIRFRQNRIDSYEERYEFWMGLFFKL